MSGFGGLKRLEGAWGTWVGLENLRGLRSLRGREGLGLDLVEMLMFGWDFKVNAYLRFWNCNTYVQDLWTVNCDLVIWTQPSGPLCLWQCFFIFLALVPYKICPQRINRGIIYGLTKRQRTASNFAPWRHNSTKTLVSDLPHRWKYHSSVPLL